MEGAGFFVLVNSFTTPVAHRLMSMPQLNGPYNHLKGHSPTVITTIVALGVTFEHTTGTCPRNLLKFKAVQTAR